MSSGQVIPFTRQYNSFRVSNGLTNDATSTVRMNGSANTNTSRGSLSSKHRMPLRDDATSTKSSLTPRLCRKQCGTNPTTQVNGKSTISTANKLNLKSSPLRSPQIIRSTRVDSNWNKRVVTKGSSIHSKSPGSSGTSVESIVPKYVNNSALLSTSASSAIYNGSSAGPQKRAYNVNSGKVPNKMINTRNQDRSTLINNNNSSKNNHHTINNGINKHSTNGHITSNNNNNNNHKISVKSKENNYTSYSSKYPNGLPFEDEFYHRRRKSLSETSSNTVSSSDSSDSRNFPFEDDEFSRKPSNEALYVDFTKSFHNNESKLSTTNRLLRTTALSAQMTKSSTSNKVPLSEYNRRINGVHSSCNSHIYKNGLLENGPKKAASASLINGYNKQLLQHHQHTSGKNSISSGNNINNNFIKTAVTVKPVANYLSGGSATTAAVTSWVPKSKQPITTILPTSENEEDDIESDSETETDEDVSSLTNRSNSEGDYKEHKTVALEPTIKGKKYVPLFYKKFLFTKLFSLIQNFMLVACIYIHTGSILLLNQHKP